MKKLTEKLYQHESTCHVYVLKQGDSAVLIDFGDGSVLDGLPSIGVKRVAAVLMTHHHRDQGQGLPKAVAANIPIYVPHTEQKLFRDVEEHWQGRPLLNNYNMRQDRFSLLEGIPIAGTLKDYSTHVFAGMTFEIVPTPGHTVGSITVMTSQLSMRIAFTGDLIAGPGKLWSMAALQWSYNGAEGAAASIASLLDLKDRQPDLLLPSHGTRMTEPEQAVDSLIAGLWDLLQQRKQNPRLFQLRERPYEDIAPNLLMCRSSMANYYVVRSRSGKALLIDFGYDFLTGIAAGSDRASRRPWLYNIGKLKLQYGIDKIDAVMLTHYHDDHVAGCNLLRDVEGAEVWAAELFADILEQPCDYDLPCLWYDPIPVDRVLPVERKIGWEEYEFELHPLPGHTRYAVAIACEVGGKRVLFGGDQYQGDDGLAWNYVYQNRFDYDDYVNSATLYRSLRPDVILTGHWKPLWPSQEYWDLLDERGQELERLHRELLPLDELDLGAEGFAARIKPYQYTSAPGETIVYTVEVRNPYGEEADIAATLAAPAGWRVEPDTDRTRVPARQSRQLSFRVTPPLQAQDDDWRRHRIAADVRIGDKAFGQQAEAIVIVRRGADGIEAGMTNTDTTDGIATNTHTTEANATNTNAKDACSTVADARAADATNVDARVADGGG